MTTTLYQGDCLEVLRELPSGSAAVVLADPPYSINTKSDGRGKLNPWADLCNAAYWYTAWISEARRILRPDGCLWSFLSWRSIVTFQKAACDARWPIESLLVWDKGWIGPGGFKGLRPSYELVALWAMPEFVIHDRTLADLQRFPWSSHKPSGHPAEKPRDLLRWLLEHSAPGLVVDPFMGSGTGGLAAAELGRDYVGIEQDPSWFALSQRQIGAVTPLLVREG